MQPPEDSKAAIQLRNLLSTHTKVAVLYMFISQAFFFSWHHCTMNNPIDISYLLTDNESMFVNCSHTILLVFLSSLFIYMLHSS